MTDRVDHLNEQAEHLRNLLAIEGDGSKAASLSRELRAIDKELAELAPAAPKQKGVDQLAAKRKKRLTAPPADDSAAARD